MMMRFEVVCPEQDNKFSYYSMHLDHRLIKNVGFAPEGGCMVELITGQTIHVSEAKFIIESELKYYRGLQAKADREEIHTDDL